MTTTAPPRRYAVVGTGHRAELYFSAMLGSHADVAVPVALCDPNATRMAYYARLWEQARPAADPLPTYRPDQFEDLLREVRPDAVVVASVDHTHAAYVDRCLRAGTDVITEKPLTTDATGCRTIVDAVRATGRELVVTFNYRYSPRNSAVKRLLAEGAIGEVTSVHFEWVLDTVHGADYFRRWHRDKAQSGGLFVHKATHHFDLVNWWVDDVPDTVFAFAGLRFYGDRNASSRGLGERPLRSHGSASAADDPFALHLAADDRLRALYLDAERDDGYLRDRDVFAPGITIEDNLSLLLRYAGGATLTYSLNAHAPWEGYRVSINGTQGRLELSVVERAAVLARSADAVVGGFGTAVDPSATATPAPQQDVRPEGTSLVLQRHWELPQQVDVCEQDGAHGGGDARLLDDLLLPDPPPDPLGRRAGYLDGIRSVLVGVAANTSLSTGAPVRMSDFGIGLSTEPPTTVRAGGRT